jgi:hypothetical protein
MIVRGYCHQLDDEEQEGLKPKIDHLLIGKPRIDNATTAFQHDRLPNRSEV